MWYVFPQLRGLGRPHWSAYYGIADLAEARAYLAHPVLGPRLIECATTTLAIADRSVNDVFGSIDARKLQASASSPASAESGPSAAAGRPVRVQAAGGWQRRVNGGRS